MTPRLDVSESEKKFEVQAELPGVEEKDLDVSVSDGILTIKASKQAEKEEKGKTWHRVERSFGTYQRSLSLPSSADADKIKATFEKGVLTISVPKRAELEPPTRKISIKSS
ncbi:MAG: Hsp20/alpha crystallin family protein [Alphaproteobacteria bacterium]|nr:Hsp20/alpha crystallin family protein [Alphaproteobacteria bacterium]